MKIEIKSIRELKHELKSNRINQSDISSQMGSGMNKVSDILNMNNIHSIRLIDVWKFEKAVERLFNATKCFRKYDITVSWTLVITDIFHQWALDYE